MAFDVLSIFDLLTIDVTRQVEVKLVLLDLLERHHPAIAGNIEIAGKSIDDLVNVLSAQPILRAVLNEALGRVDHENTFAGLGILFVDHDNASGDARAVKQVRDRKSTRLNSS